MGVPAAPVPGALQVPKPAGQQTLTLFAFDKWRAAYATADELTRATIRANTAMYVLLLLGFAIWNLQLRSRARAQAGTLARDGLLPHRRLRAHAYQPQPAAEGACAP